jgi:hypothetical protein
MQYLQAFGHHQVLHLRQLPGRQHKYGKVCNIMQIGSSIVWLPVLTILFSKVPLYLQYVRSRKCLKKNLFCLGKVTEEKSRIQIRWVRRSEHWLARLQLAFSVTYLL